MDYNAGYIKDNDWFTMLDIEDNVWSTMFGINDNVLVYSVAHNNPSTDTTNTLNKYSNTMTNMLIQ